MNGVSESQVNLQSAAAMLDLGRYAEAEYQAMKVPPDDGLFSSALEIAAISMQRADRCPEAIVLLEYAASIDPDNASILYNLGVFCSHVGDVDASMLAYQRCLRIDPDHSDALWNYSEQLRVSEHFDMALELLQRLERILSGPRLSDFYHRLAVTLSHLGQNEASRTAFERSLSLGGSEPAVTQWEYSHLLLALGDWEKGWAAYDYRFVAGDKTHVVCHRYPYPVWQGESLEGKTLFIHGEQGLGDEIMFGQIVFTIKDEAEQIIWGCRPSLVSLFAGSHPEIEVVPHDVVAQAADLSAQKIDYQIPICSLARLRRSKTQDFENAQGALTADRSKIDEFNMQLTRLSGSENGAKRKQRYRVGIMWGANPSRDVSWARKRSVQKSIPAEQLRLLARFREQIQFVSLQNKDAGLEAAHIPELDLLDFHQDLMDFSDTAALVANMDLVISVDTSVAHLAGAQGKPVWILLMHHADWRWMQETQTSVWYKSARLFRQKSQGEWGSVVADLETALAEWLENRQ